MRLLMITDDPAAETSLHEPLEGIAGGEELEVKVVAPLRPESTLDLITGDDALAEFEADRVVLVDPDDEELAAAVRERYGLPVTELSAG